MSSLTLLLQVGEKGGSWHKGREGAGKNYIWPVPQDADQVAFHVIRLTIQL